MKRFVVFSMLLVMTLTAAYAQKAQKPKVMIMPSKNFCISHSYGSYVTNGAGKNVFVCDYEKALADQDLSLIITGTEQFFTKNGFPLENLAATLEKMAINDAVQSMNDVDVGPNDLIFSSARPDIYIDLDFKVCKKGPMTQIQGLNLEARDAATTQLIYGKTGDSSSSTSATLTTLCQEVVNSYADEFLAQLTTFFTDMYNNGRKIEVVFRMNGSSPYKFDESIEVNGKEYDLNKLIENQIRKASVNGSYTVTTSNKVEMRFQMRAPIFREEEDPFDGTTATVSVNAATIGQDMKAFLNNKKYFPFKEEGIKIAIYPQGVGIVNIFIGDK